jgi:hypothetical protein
LWTRVSGDLPDWFPALIVVGDHWNTAGADAMTKGFPSPVFRWLMGYQPVMPRQVWDGPARLNLVEQ